MDDNRELSLNENEFDNSASIYTLASLIQTSAMSTMESSELSSNMSLDPSDKVTNTTGVGKLFKEIFSFVFVHLPYLKFLRRSTSLMYSPYCNHINYVPNHFF